MPAKPNRAPVMIFRKKRLQMHCCSKTKIREQLDISKCNPGAAVENVDNVDNVDDVDVHEDDVDNVDNVDDVDNVDNDGSVDNINNHPHKYIHK